MILTCNQVPPREPQLTPSLLHFFFTVPAQINSHNAQVPQRNAAECSDVAQMQTKAQAEHNTPYFHCNFSPCLTCSLSHQIGPLCHLSPKCHSAIASKGPDTSKKCKTFTLKNLHFKTKSKHIIPNFNFFICYFTYVFKDSYLTRRTRFPLQFSSCYILVPLCDAKVSFR